jgi:NADH:ubiquinone reductase (H+-translocating)
MTHKKHILIVGGGFGGIKAALELERAGGFTITLVSNNPNFRYNPSLYHTATGGMAVQSNIPLTHLFAGKNVQLEQGEARELNRQAKTIKTVDGRSFHYDILILSLGMVTNYFGIKGLPEYSYGIKTLEEAERFKQHLHQQLIEDGKPDLNYVVVGGGPTGIELAGALPGYLQSIMRAHGIRTKRINIELVEAAPHLVPRMPEHMSKAIEYRLKYLGIKLILGQAVQGETADALHVGGRALKSHTVVWTAGQANAPFFKENAFTLTDHGKVAVDEHLQAEPDIYVLGDNNNTTYSGMAQTALHDATFVARNVVRAHEGKKPKHYKPKKPTYVLPAGPHWAAVLWKGVQLYGRIGWALRSAADWIGFHDLEPWWRATEQWMTEFGNQEECPICVKRANEVSSQS